MKQYKVIFVIITSLCSLLTTSNAQWLEDTIPVGNRPWTLIYNSLNNKVYCANGGASPYFDTTVTVIDGATDSVIATIRVGTYPLALVYNTINKKVYCANDYSNTVTVIDDTSNSVDTTIQVGTSPRAFPGIRLRIESMSQIIGVTRSQ